MASATIVQHDTVILRDADHEASEIRVLVVLEQRFERTPDGMVWGPGTCGKKFFGRYLEVFDSVTVLARLRDVLVPSESLEQCNGDDVKFAPVPHYVGPWGFLKNRKAIRAVAIGALESRRSVIVRVPSLLGSCLIPHLKRVQQPYAVEVIGDAFDVLAPRAFRHPLRPLFRSWLTRQQRSDCRNASAAAYVTERALQRRYPCGGYSVNVSDVQVAPHNNDVQRVFTTHYSSIGLTECVAVPRVYSTTAIGETVIVTVATLAQMYKGIDVLIDSVARCVADKLDVRLVVIGDGKYRGELASRAATRGIAHRVRFAGFLRRDQITAELDAADIFVLPSRQEGLPRALIEAMARGLPCIASSVGGIPELLATGDQVPPDNVEQLSLTIKDAVLDVNRRAEMSSRNLIRAHDFFDDKLSARRLAFYAHVRDGTEAWAVGIEERVVIAKATSI